MDAVLFRTSLPERSLFPREMPRYPNVFFFIAEELALRGVYFHALRFLEKLLDERLGLRDSFCDDVRNPNLRVLVGKPGEGSDWQARIERLHFFIDTEVPALSHFHQLHARFYVSPLIAAGRERVEAEAGGRKLRCFLVPASVHYEVATEESTHPYIDSCPLCGITGDYAFEIDRKSEDYCLKIHDPLGVEFLLHGTVRGKSEPETQGSQRPCLVDLRDEYEVFFEELSPGPHSCERLAGVFLGPRKEKPSRA